MVTHTKSQNSSFRIAWCLSPRKRPAVRVCKYFLFLIVSLAAMLPFCDGAAEQALLVLVKLGEIQFSVGGVQFWNKLCE